MSEFESEHQGHEPDADEIEINLRPAAEVARRLVALGAVAARVFLELKRITPHNATQAMMLRVDLLAWLDFESLLAELTSAEYAMMRSPLQSLPPEEAIDLSWSAEEAAALGWAIGLLDKPLPYVRQFKLAKLLPHLPEPLEDTREFIAAARLRPLAEIAVARERAELWHWRGMLAFAIDLAAPAPRERLTALIPQVAAEAATAGHFKAPKGGDFPVGGKPFASLPLEDQGNLAMIAMHRLIAFNWVCGYGDDWDSVPLDLDAD